MLNANYAIEAGWLAKYYTLFIHPNALRGLYAIPRGVAGELTAAIRMLETDPTPPQAISVLGRSNRYELRLTGYVAVYQLDEEQRKVTLLLVEPA